VSCLGSTFVVNQVWNTIMFSREVVGTANATAGGWGNLGGGLTQTLMPLLYRFFHDGLGLELHYAWRASMLVPPAIFLTLACWIFFCCQDTTAGKFDVAILGKTQKAGPMTYLSVLKDYRVVLMMFQYSACFGCELVLNNTLATHFVDYFGVDIVAAGALAMSFGGMNLFARSLGGILSDGLNKRFAMPGRLWAHFISLVGQAIFLFLFGCVTSDMGWPVALVCLCILSIFVNMAEGTSYAIVPYMIPQEVPVVSAMVGAAGTFGALIATRLCYMTTEDDLLPFKTHSIYVLIAALSVIPMKWHNMGWMFGGANIRASKFQQQALEDAENKALEDADKKKVAEAITCKTEEAPTTENLPDAPPKPAERKEESV
jgi:NNP family nitrate/nitrite transporter-like MFS transporter